MHFLLLVLLSLSVQAQTWTASTPAAGTFYLYNIGYDGFLVGSNNWTTRASLTKVGGIPVVLQQADTDDSFYISTSPTYDGRFLGSDGYVDKSNTDNYTAWQFIPVEGQQDTYLLLAKATNNYLVGHDTDATKTSLTTTIPNNERGYWKLATKESLIQNLANATKSAPLMPPLHSSIHILGLMEQPPSGMVITKPTATHPTQAAHGRPKEPSASTATISPRRCAGGTRK